jgi:hypothetical protein
MAAASTQNGAGTKPPEGRLLDEVRGGVDDLLQLGRLEIELAKLEAGTAAKRIGIGAGLAVFALLILYIGVIYALGALPDKLGAFEHWWGWVATGGAFMLLALLIAFVSFRFIRRAVNEAKGTFETMKGDLEWLRQLANRP